MYRLVLGQIFCVILDKLFVLPPLYFEYFKINFLYFNINSIYLYCTDEKKFVTLRLKNDNHFNNA